MSLFCRLRLHRWALGADLGPAGRRYVCVRCGARKIKGAHRG